MAPIAKEEKKQPFLPNLTSLNKFLSSSDSNSKILIIEGKPTALKDTEIESKKTKSVIGRFFGFNIKRADPEEGRRNVIQLLNKVNPKIAELLPSGGKGISVGEVKNAVMEYQVDINLQIVKKLTESTSEVAKEIKILLDLTQLPLDKKAPEFKNFLKIVPEFASANLTKQILTQILLDYIKEKRSSMPTSSILSTLEL